MNLKCINLQSVENFPKTRVNEAIVRGRRMKKPVKGVRRLRLQNVFRQRPGKRWKRNCGKIGVQNKFRDGWKNARRYALAMSGSISIFWLISKQTVICIPIYGNMESAANAMASMIGEENYQIGSVLKSGRRSWSNASAWAIGKSTP